MVSTVSIRTRAGGQGRAFFCSLTSLVAAVSLAACGASASHRSVAKPLSPANSVALAGGSGGHLGSRPFAITSFAQVRAHTQAIAIVTAGDSRQEVVQRGVGAGGPITRTDVTVDKVLWGSVASQNIIISRFLSVERMGEAPYEAGQRYLLFLTPDDIEPELGTFAVSEAVGYSLYQGQYRLMSDDLPRLPQMLDPLIAEQTVIS